MDQQSFQHRPAVSVNTSLPPQTFQQYLRTAANNNFLAPQQHQQQLYPRPLRVVPSQAAPRHHYRYQQYQPLLQFTPQHFNTMNPALNNHNLPFAPGYSSGEAKAFFAGHFDDASSGAGSAGIMPSAYHHPALSFGTFRPLGPPAQATAPQSTMLPSKEDVPIQHSNVDTSKYESVSEEEICNTPVDFADSSPSSAESEQGWPATPDFENHEAWHGWSAGKWDVFGSKFDAHAGVGLSFPSVNDLSSSFGSFSSSSSLGSSSFTGSALSGAGSFSSCSTSFIEPSDLTFTHAGSRLHEPQFGVPSLGDSKMSMGAIAEDSDVDDDATSAVSSSSSLGSGTKNDRDNLLLSMRRQGFSYKEIKRLGKFPEAESTLRGRMRVLTKEKHERVRRPEWQKGDIELLRRGVRKFVSSSSAGARKKSGAKLPWRKISDWMKENGASYDFAAATCAKQWKSIVRK